MWKLPGSEKQIVNLVSRFRRVERALKRDCK
jgi:hypothetical protein